jgi:phospholipid/cholesterol/gamma-HCH transport system substrate-binding protein
MVKNYFETIIGLIVIFVSIYFAAFSFNKSNTKEDSGYNLKIFFDRVDGLSIGSDVKISGLKVGTVTDAKINEKTYQAEIEISLKDSVKIPADSTAEIISAGLLGDKYIALVPGGDEKYLKKGDKIKFSQSSVSIESLIGKFMFSNDDKENKKDQKSKEETDLF